MKEENIVETTCNECNCVYSNSELNTIIPSDEKEPVGFVCDDCFNEFDYDYIYEYDSGLRAYVERRN